MGVDVGEGDGVSVGIGVGVSVVVGVGEGGGSFSNTRSSAYSTTTKLSNEPLPSKSPRAACSDPLQLAPHTFAKVPLPSFNQQLSRDDWRPTR